MLIRLAQQARRTQRYRFSLHGQSSPAAQVSALRWEHADPIRFYADDRAWNLGLIENPDIDRPQRLLESLNNLLRNGSDDVVLRAICASETPRGHRHSVKCVPWLDRHRLARDHHQHVVDKAEVDVTFMEVADPKTNELHADATIVAFPEIASQTAADQYPGAMSPIAQHVLPCWSRVKQIRREPNAEGSFRKVLEKPMSAPTDRWLAEFINQFAGATCLRGDAVGGPLPSLIFEPGNQLLPLAPVAAAAHGLKVGFFSLPAPANWNSNRAQYLRDSILHDPLKPQAKPMNCWSQWILMARAKVPSCQGVSFFGSKSAPLRKRVALGASTL